MFDWCRVFVFSSLSPRRGRNFEHEWPNSKHNWCNWGWEAKGLGNGWPITVETCRNMEKPWTRAAVEGDSQHPETGTTRTSLSMVENCWVKIFDFPHPKGKNYPQIKKTSTCEAYVKHKCGFLSCLDQENPWCQQNYNRQGEAYRKWGLGCFSGEFTKDLAMGQVTYMKWPDDWGILGI